VPTIHTAAIVATEVNVAHVKQMKPTYMSQKREKSRTNYIVTKEGNVAHVNI